MSTLTSPTVTYSAILNIMRTESHIFWLPRKGHDPAEYEDAFAADDGAGRYAVADGASEGCFTDLWARLLVEDFVHQADGVEHWLTSLPAVQRRWDAEVRARNIPWHAAPGVEQGAHAAFLGLALTISPLPPLAGERMGEGQREDHLDRDADAIEASPHPTPLSQVDRGSSENKK